MLVAGGLLFLFEIATDDRLLTVKNPFRNAGLPKIIFLPRRKKSDSASLSMERSFKVFFSG
jgi:hypothetical protein